MKAVILLFVLALTGCVKRLSFEESVERMTACEKAGFSFVVTTNDLGSPTGVTCFPKDVTSEAQKKVD